MLIGTVDVLAGVACGFYLGWLASNAWRARQVQKLASADASLASKGTSLQWCSTCGEGVTTFCRGKMMKCPKALPQINWHAKDAIDVS